MDQDRIIPYYSETQNLVTGEVTMAKRLTLLKEKDAAKLQSCSSAVVSRLLGVALKSNGLPVTGWHQPNRQFPVDGGRVVELR